MPSRILPASRENSLWRATLHGHNPVVSILSGHNTNGTSHYYTVKNMVDFCDVSNACKKSRQPTLDWGILCLCYWLMYMTSFHLQFVIIQTWYHVWVDRDVQIQSISHISIKTWLILWRIQCMILWYHDSTNPLVKLLQEHNKLGSKPSEYINLNAFTRSSESARFLANQNDAKIYQQH